MVLLVLVFKFYFMNVKYLLFFVSFFFLILSCNKDNLDSNTTITKDYFKKIDLLNMSDEAQRIYKIYSQKDYSGSFYVTSNHGKIIEAKVNGKIPNDVSIIINDEVIRTRENGMFLIRKKSYSNYFGKTVNFILKDSEIEKKYELYIPLPLALSSLSDKSESYSSIRREGNDLTWEVDSGNKLGLLFTYYLFDKDSKILDHGFEILEDNGKYNIDHILKNKSAKKIQFKFTRGNAVNFVNKIQENVMIAFRANDHHQYAID